ncbi:MAG: hypothetical protein AAB535_02370 [Patescibacteria group bacterium]
MLLSIYYFDFVFGRSFDKALLILADLFLWITFFFVALSANEVALNIESRLLSFLAFLKATSSFEMIILLTLVFLWELLKALLAVLVTGIPIV